MAARIRVLMHYYHAGSLGHGRRVMALARAMKRLDPEWDVLVAAGGVPVQEAPPPLGVEVVQLPALTSEPEPSFKLRPANLSLTCAEVIAMRRDLLKDLCRHLRPNVLITEFFPFGRQFLDQELLPLLRLVRRQRPRALILSSLRDMMGQPKDVWSPEAARRAGQLIVRHYDRVLVHGDPSLHAIEPELSLGGAMESRALERLTYSGYVLARDRRELRRPGNVRAGLGAGDRSLVVVSAGGGKDGFSLLRCAARAERLLNGSGRGERYRFLIVAGPFLPSRDLGKLKRLAAGREQLMVRPFARHLPDMINSADVSVGMGGYNSCAEVMQTRTPAIIVPRTSWEEEQLTRARLLEGRGLARVLEPASLSPTSLAAAIQEQSTLPRSRHRVMLGGALFTARYIAQEIQRRGV